MTYVQYFDYNLAGKLDWVLGDRGVVILDGRNRLSRMKADAQQFNGYRRPKYKAFQIYKGRSFSDSAPITEMEML